MNPFSGATWLWRAWRGYSVTFAVLFAMGMVGLSVISLFRSLLHRLGAPWWVLFLAPFVVVGLLAKHEARWMPDADQRRRWARRLVLGSFALMLIIAWFSPRKPAPTVAPTNPEWNQIRR